MSTTGGMTPDIVLRASDDWKWLPAGAELLDIRGVPVIDYPDWARMGFYAMPHRVPEPLDEVIQAVSDGARARSKPETSWWVSPSTEPRTIEEALARAGGTITERTEIMALDMAERAPCAEPADDITCRVVTDAQTLDHAERVAAAVWGGQPSGPERRAQQLRDLGDPLDHEGGFRVVTYLDGVPVCTGGCQVVGNVARLYAGATVPEARGRGAYRASVGTRLQVAWEHGARIGLVHARVNTSLPILSRLGFKSYGEARLYTVPV